MKALRKEYPYAMIIRFIIACLDFIVWSFLIFFLHNFVCLLGLYCLTKLISSPYLPFSTLILCKYLLCILFFLMWYMLLTFAFTKYISVICQPHSLIIVTRRTLMLITVSSICLLLKITWFFFCLKI